MIRFFTQAFKNYRSTGALAPSSRFLARTIVQSIPEHSPKRMLEVGCGTGAFTKEILNTLRDGDSFHIVELNPEFCKTVEATVLKKFREGHPDIEVIMHNAPIEEANLEGKFDAIHLFQVMLSFLKKDCELAYFEYLGMRGFKSIFGFPRVRRGTKIRTTDIDTRYEKQAGSQQIVWRNFPSCRVVRLKKC